MSLCRIRVINLSAVSWNSIALGAAWAGWTTAKHNKQNVKRRRGHLVLINVILIMTGGIWGQGGMALPLFL
jgi:hypothetical protein